MEFIGLNGKKHKINVQQYRVDWERKVSKPQAAVKKFLRPYWSTHLVLEEMRIPGTLMRIDLLNLTRKIIIEVSPSSSHSYNAFFHKGDKMKFANAVKRDLDKCKWAEINNFTYIEIVDEDMEKLSKKWFLDEYGVTL